MTHLDYVYYEESARMNKRWYAVDFDGTLAESSGTMETCGKPIPKMVERVKEWLAKGEVVKIFTARVSGPEHWETFKREQRAMLQAWSLEHIGQALEVTCTKDFALIEIWDDRANGVDPDTGWEYKDLVSHLRSRVADLQGGLKGLEAKTGEKAELYWGDDCP
jgi:hypothetical protein